VWARRSAALVAPAIVCLAGSCAAPVVVASAAAPALQAGTAAFINGELEAAEIAPIETVYEASLSALKDLQFQIFYERPGDRTAYIFAHESAGVKITVFLEHKSPVVTKINIRIGVFGDQAISRLILGEIQARCPALPPIRDTVQPEHEGPP
jgi:hypothetical protein